MVILRLKFPVRPAKKKKGGHWDPENDQWNLALTLTMPLFEGGLKTAQVSKAKAIYKQAVAERLSITNEALASLEQMWSALQDSIENVDVQFKLLTAYQERSNIARGQYSIGLISFDNWIIIEDGLVSAKKSYLNAQANALLAEANWIKAKGETLEYAQ